MRIAGSVWLVLATLGYLQASPVQWAIASGGNDHYYDKIGGSFTVFSAQADLTASHSTLRGMTAYLVPITSQAEQDFVHALSPASEWWTSGSDEGSPGNWIWT